MKKETNTDTYWRTEGAGIVKDFSLWLVDNKYLEEGVTILLTLQWLGLLSADEMVEELDRHTRAKMQSQMASGNGPCVEALPRAER